MPMTDDQALDAHILAADAEAKAEVCSSQSTAFAQEFGRRYQAWRHANAEALRRGVALAEVKGMNGSSPPSLNSLARMRAQLLAELPADDRQRRCDELLSLFAQPEPKGGSK